MISGTSLAFRHRSVSHRPFVERSVEAHVTAEMSFCKVHRLMRMMLLAGTKMAFPCTVDEPPSYGLHLSLVLCEPNNPEKRITYRNFS